MADDDGERKVFVPLAKAPDGSVIAAFESENGDTGLSLMTTDPHVEAGSIAEVEAVMPDGSFLATVRPVNGPARVNSAAYRAGWDRIFGGKAESTDEYDA